MSLACCRSCLVEAAVSGWTLGSARAGGDAEHAVPGGPGPGSGPVRSRAFTEDFAGDPPNVAVTGWRKRRKGGWRRAYAVVTATGVAFDAATRELRYAVVQFPGQAGVTKGFRGGGEGGARREALRFCAGFVDCYNSSYEGNPCPGIPG